MAVLDITLRLATGKYKIVNEPRLITVEEEITTDIEESFGDRTLHDRVDVFPKVSASSRRSHQQLLLMLYSLPLAP